MVWSVLENEHVDDLLDINFDDINDPSRVNRNMEQPLPLSERTISNNKLYKNLHRYSPIKSSLNIKHLNKFFKPQQDFSTRNLFNELLKEKDNLKSLPKEEKVVRVSHKPHNQLLQSAFPNHIYRNQYKSNLNHRKQVKQFSKIKTNIIEAYMEEDLEVEGVQFIQGFTTTSRYPEEHCIQHLINSLLITNETRGLSCYTYNTLKHIQSHHSLSIKYFPESWDQIMENLKPLGETCNSYGNRLLYLDLLTNVIENDFLQRKLNKKRCFLWIMLCPDHKMLNLSKVINLLINVVERNESDSLRVKERQEAIFLLQKLLAMSVFVSQSTVDGATKIAEDMLYPFRNIVKLEHRRHLLETIQSDVLRLKLLELWLENCCELQDDSNNHPPSAKPISVTKIVHRHFKRKPSGDVEDVSMACEELSLMLSLLLKSYLAYIAGKVKPSPKESAACYCGLQLSLEDKTVLVEMGDVVAQLRYHLNSFAELTPNTLLYISSIEIMRDLVDV